MKISVFGTGYVGLVTGTCFAEMGNDVICADIDQTKISNLLKGISPIYEPGLDQLILNNVKAGRLSFTTDLTKATREGDLLFIAVGTPPNEDGSADLQYVLRVAETIGENLNDYKNCNQQIDRARWDWQTGERKNRASFRKAPFIHRIRRALQPGVFKRRHRDRRLLKT